MVRFYVFDSVHVSDSLQPYGLQHARLPCPSPTPRVYSNSSIESVMSSHHLILCCPLLLLPSVFPSIRVFSKESVLALGSQSIGASASASVLPMNIQDWFPLRWTGWISLHPRDSQESSPTPQFKSINFSVLIFLYGQLSHLYMTTRKTIALTTWTFVGKIISLLFNMLSRLIIFF